MAELNIHQRLAEVQKKIAYIQKEKGGDLKYAIVTHDAVTANVRPHMVSVGVLYYPVKIVHVGTQTYTVRSKFGERTEHRVELHITLRFVNIDEPTDYIDVESFAHGVDSGDKGPGKAISYAVKMALLKALGLETGEAEESEYDQEDRSAVTKEEQALRDYEEAIGMAVSTDELRKVSGDHKDKIGPLRSDRKWKAEATKLDTLWRERMAKLKKQELEREPEDEEETEAAGPEEEEAAPPKGKKKDKYKPLTGVDYLGGG